MAPADALLNPLWVPGQIVIDDQITELEADAFGGGFGGDHDAGFVAEEVNQGGAFVTDCPIAVDALTEVVSVGPVEEDHLAGELSCLEKIEKIILGASGLGKDERLLLKRTCLLEVDGASLLEAVLKGGEEPLAFGVALDAGGERMELAQFDDLLPPLLSLLRGKDDLWLRRVCVQSIVVISPLFFKLWKKLEVVGKLDREDRAARRALGSFQLGGESRERTGNGVGRAGEQFAQH